MVLRVTLMIWLVACSVVVSPATACTEDVEIAKPAPGLFQALRSATSEAEGDAIAAKIWDIWLTAPDAQSEQMLSRGIARRGAYDLEESERILDDLIAYCPAYTEAYNQRAFSRFMRGRLDESLADIDVVLARIPEHFGALSGRAMVLNAQGRAHLAQKALREAVSVHPWLRERAYLVREPGEKI